MHRTRIRLVALVATPLLFIGLVGCSSDDFNPTNRADAISQLADNFMDDEFPGTRAEAVCLSEAIIDSVGFERIRAALDAGDDLDEIEDDALVRDLSGAMFAAVEDCMGMSAQELFSN